MKKKDNDKIRNIKLILAYDGGQYSGWQRLGDDSEVTNSTVSLQRLLESIFCSYLGEPIKIIGSGRTDRGVHALGQVINFHTTRHESVNVLIKEMNVRLPDDICILSGEEVEIDFHSRYSVLSKTYQYRMDLSEKPSVFFRKYTLSVPFELDILSMNKASEYILGTHDFRGFSMEKNMEKNTIRRIHKIDIYWNVDLRVQKESQLYIDVTGDGFLNHMVRIIVGTLIEIGQGKKKPEVVKEVLRSKDRTLAGKTVSSHGLFLKQVNYPQAQPELETALSSDSS